MGRDPTKKRKIETIVEEQENEIEEDEEEKMEMFFALVRSARQMRDRMRSLDGSKAKEEKKKLEEDNQRVSEVWNPSFQPEDFVEDGKDISQAGPSKREEEKSKEGEGGTDLDLKLSLQG